VAIAFVDAPHRTGSRQNPWLLAWRGPTFSRTVPFARPSMLVSAAFASIASAVSISESAAWTTSSPALSVARTCIATSCPLAWNASRLKAKRPPLTFFAASTVNAASPRLSSLLAVVLSTLSPSSNCAPCSTPLLNRRLAAVVPAFARRLLT